MAGFEIVERLPTSDEHRALCIAVGWAEAVNLDAVPAALAHSLAGSVARAEGETVGMARLVGDGAIYLYVQDVAVLPSHQGRGIGRALVRSLLRWVAANAPDRAFVGLFATAEAAPLYRQEGFEAHPELTGMFRVTPIDVD